jgi:PAS domain S-box-containing protein
MTDVDNNIVHVNDAFLDITGYTREAALGKNPKVLKSGNHDKHFYQKMWDQLDKEGYFITLSKNRYSMNKVYL